MQCGRTVRAIDGVRAGAEMHRARPLNSVVRLHLSTQPDISNKAVALGIGKAFALCYGVGNLALIIFGAMWFGHMFRGGWISLGLLIALFICLVPPPPSNSRRLLIAQVIGVGAFVFVGYLLVTAPRLVNGQFDAGHALFLVQLAVTVLAMPLLITKGHG